MRSVIFAWLGLLVILGLFAWMAHSQRFKRHADIVCLGDSLTVCGGVGGRYTDFLAQAMPGVRIVNRGVGGDTLAGGRQRLDRDVLRLNPKVVIVELGAVDWKRGTRPIEALHMDLGDIVSRIREHGAEVVIAGVFGDQIDENGHAIGKIYKPEITDTLSTKEFGDAILAMEKEVAAQYDAGHVPNIQARLNKLDYWENHSHPNKAGNKLVMEQLLPKVKEAWERANAKQAESGL